MPAGSYAFGIARNYAFIDGNKRTALTVSMTFLDRNGGDIEAPFVEAYLTFLHLVEGSLNEYGLAIWFEKYAIPLIPRARFKSSEK
jgi:death-on-curing protein